MQFDPKLKKAMEEIKGILAKHDVGAVIILHRPGFSEYLNKFNPTYGAVEINGDKITVKGKAEHYPSKQERDKHLENSINMLTHFQDITGQTFLNCDNILAQLKEKIEWDNTDGNHSSHTEQNN